MNVVKLTIYDEILEFRLFTGDVLQCEGYFLLKFKSVADRDAVLRNGPYTIYNMTMFVKEWVTGFNLKDDMLRTLLIWVKLPSLPLHLWGSKILGKIGSAIGKPMFSDECTANKLRVSYARILVEVDITKKTKGKH